MYRVYSLKIKECKYSNIIHEYCYSDSKNVIQMNAASASSSPYYKLITIKKSSYDKKKDHEFSLKSTIYKLFIKKQSNYPGF